MEVIVRFRVGKIDLLAEAQIPVRLTAVQYKPRKMLETRLLTGSFLTLCWH